MSTPSGTVAASPGGASQLTHALGDTGMHAAALLTAAKQYATYWQGTEQAVVLGLRSDERSQRRAALDKAARYFKVSRNFPTRFDVRCGVERLAPALDILESHRQVALTQANLEATVGCLRRELAEAYGKRDLLSAATKFLWVVRQDPVVIFDSQVRTALGTTFGDYGAYVAAWLKKYEELAPLVDNACASLPRALPCDAQWFKRRVLDIHLWNLGAPRDRKRPMVPS